MIEKHLLFAVLAFESELLDLAQLTAACRAWAADKSKPLADLLIERGWITADARGFVEMQLERKLAKHQHDPRVTLNAITRGDVCDAIKEIDDPDIQQSLSSWPSSGPILLEAIGETLLETELPKSRYTWLSEVGRGGRGRVWLARDNALSREVALKELIPGSATNEAARRLIKEAQITGQLQHPNIVPVYEVNCGGRPFYTMKLVKGETLSQAVQRHHAQCRAGQEDPKTMPEFLRIFLSICDALAYAHSRGIIHRDLKPRNIVLGEYGEAIVLDWGLARQLGTVEEASPPIVLTEDGHTEATIAGQTLGTPAYMAPEQASGRIDLLDHRTDIYGLGAILFEILTGHAPHEHRSPSGREDSRAPHTPAPHELLQSSDAPRAPSSIAVLLHQITTGKTPHVRGLDASIPEELDAICGKAMAKTRDERYQTAKDLKAALLDFQVHKESIDFIATISDRLDRAKQSKQYEDFQRTLYGFEEALRQWPESTEARVGIERTQAAFAELSLERGDYDLGLKQLSTNVDAHSELLTKLTLARSEREGRVRYMKILKWTAIALLIGVAGVSALAAKGQYDLVGARVERENAVKEKDKAEGEKKNAVAERLLAETEKKGAEADRLKALMARQQAVELGLDAENRKVDALKIAAKAAVDKEEADKQRVLADKKKAEAEDQARIAKLAEDKAEQNEKLAVEAALIAKKETADANEKSNYLLGLLEAHRFVLEDRYPDALKKLMQLKRDYPDRCKAEWDQLWKKVAPPE